MKLANALDSKSGGETLEGSTPSAPTTNLAWAAGLFEGEGSFFINKVKGYKYPCAELKITDLDVLTAFHSVVKIGKIRNAPKVEGEKQAWVWRSHGKVETEKLFAMIGSYLYERRTKQYNRVMLMSLL